jgi:hypothetical protein
MAQLLITESYKNTGKIFVTGKYFYYFKKSALPKFIKKRKIEIRRKKRETRSTHFQKGINLKLCKPNIFLM